MNVSSSGSISGSEGVAEGDIEASTIWTPTGRPMLLDPTRDRDRVAVDALSVEHQAELERRRNRGQTVVHRQALLELSGQRFDHFDLSDGEDRQSLARVRISILVFPFIFVGFGGDAQS